jgi:hypothetical protein
MHYATIQLFCFPGRLGACRDKHERLVHHITSHHITRKQASKKERKKESQVVQCNAMFNGGGGRSGASSSGPNTMPFLSSRSMYVCMYVHVITRSQRSGLNLCNPMKVCF